MSFKDREAEDLVTKFIASFAEGRAPLTQEQRQQAQAVANVINGEVDSLLAGEDKSSRLDPQGNLLILHGKNFTEMEATEFKGADFVVDRYMHFGIDTVTYAQQNMYVFYSDHVVHSVRNSAHTSESLPILAPNGAINRVEVSVRVPSIDPKRKDVEADANELTKLLEDIKHSQPREIKY